MHLTAKHLETTDIFHSAFFLCMGRDLAGICFKNSSTRTATFTITGRGLEQLDRDYRTGKARVNPLQLRDSLNRVRDMLFEKKRERETVINEQLPVNNKQRKSHKSRSY